MILSILFAYSIHRSIDPSIHRSIHREATFSNTKEMSIRQTRKWWMDYQSMVENVLLTTARLPMNSSGSTLVMDRIFALQPPLKNHPTAAFACAAEDVATSPWKCFHCSSVTSTHYSLFYLYILYHSTCALLPGGIWYNISIHGIGYIGSLAAHVACSEQYIRVRLQLPTIKLPQFKTLNHFNIPNEGLMCAKIDSGKGMMKHVREHTKSSVLNLSRFVFLPQMRTGQIYPVFKWFAYPSVKYAEIIQGL